MSRNDGTHRLSGALTSDEVPQIWKESRAWRDEGLPAEIDLSGVEIADSSGLALLLEWLAWAQERGDEIRFTDPPESLRTIAGLSQAGGILGWENDS